MLCAANNPRALCVNAGVPVALTFTQQRPKSIPDLLPVGMFRPVLHSADQFLRIRRTKSRFDCSVYLFCEAFCFLQIEDITNKLFIGAGVGSQSSAETMPLKVSPAGILPVQRMKHGTL